VQGVTGDNFYITMQCAVEATAKQLGATVKTQGPQKFDASLQTPIVQAVVASKPDALIIAPTDVSAMQQPIKQAVDGAQGAATGVRQAGKQGEVKIVGFDAGPEQVKALQDDTIQALIAQQPGTIGAEGVKQAVAALKGEAGQTQVQTGFTILTTDNLESPEGQAALYKAGC